MFRTIADFERMWRDESGKTLALLGGLTDEALSQAVAGGHRSLGRIAWHLVGTVSEMMNRTGLEVEGPGEEEGVPARAEEIRAAYERTSRSLLSRVKERWTDASLLAKDDMYGEAWERGSTLLALVLHQAHHRGQMTVLLRQAGLPVQGAYGPALEEWAGMGLPAPAI